MINYLVIQICIVKKQRINTLGKEIPCEEMAHDSSQNSSSSQQNIQLPKTDLNLDLEGINQEKNCAEFETAVLNKGISSTENATNAHPLMYSPVSPPGDTNVDVFPQEHVTKVNSDEDFNPKAHSSELDIEISAESQDSFEHKLNITLSALGDYNETLPGITILLNWIKTWEF